MTPASHAGSAAAGAPPVHEHHVVVSRTARYYALGEPGPDTRELWIACHGYGHLAGRWARHFVPLAAPGRVVLVPEALSRFYHEMPTARTAAAPPHERRVGASWMTREDREGEIEDQVAYLDALVDRARESLAAGAPLQVVGFGFSQGAAVVCRWAALGRAHPGRLVLWGGGVPHDLDLAGGPAALRGARLTVVVGERDQFATSAVVDEQERRLRAAGVACEVVRFDGGHHLDAATLLAVAGAVGA